MFNIVKNCKGSKLIKNIVHRTDGRVLEEFCLQIGYTAQLFEATDKKGQFKFGGNIVTNYGLIFVPFATLKKQLWPTKSCHAKQTTEGQGHSHSGEIFCKSVLPPRFPVGEQITAKFHRVSD